MKRQFFLNYNLILIILLSFFCINSLFSVEQIKDKNLKNDQPSVAYIMHCFQEVLDNQKDFFENIELLQPEHWEMVNENLEDILKALQDLKDESTSEELKQINILEYQAETQRNKIPGLQKIDKDQILKSPRSNAPSAISNDAVSGCNNSCDLTQILSLLSKVKNNINTLKQIICEKFAFTWTILEEIEEDIFNTKTILCEKFVSTWTILEDILEHTESLTNISCDFSSIFTILEEIEDDIFNTKTILCDKFVGTWTILEFISEQIEDLDITITIENLTITAVINVDLNGVFTVLEEIEEDIFNSKTVLCDKFVGTWTILEEIEKDLSGVFTAIDAISVTAIVNIDLNGVFTVLEEIEEDIFNSKTVLCNKFVGTWTILEDILEEIRSSTASSCDLSGVFTGLNTIDAALCSPIEITQADVDATTFTISQSGFYVFGENITFSPASGQPAISIEADDVTLNMCGKYLQQGNSTSGVDGFNIPGGPSGMPRSNVIIMNGTVRDFTRSGISIGRNTTTPANTACEDIVIDKMTIVGCEIRGIEFVGTIGASIINSKISNTNIVNSITSASGDFALYLIVTENIKIENCQIADSGNGSITFRAVQIEDSTKCIATNVLVCSNFGASFIGFNLDNSIGCLLTRCIAELNTSTNALTGFVLTGGTMVTGNNLTLCSVLNNTATNGPLIGFDVQTLVTRNNLNQCIVSNNLCSGTNATSHCIGFNYDEARFCVTAGCHALQNRATGNGITNRCSGFEIGTSAGGVTGTKNCNFIENRAELNNGFNDARSFGVRPLSAAGGNTDNLYFRNLGIRNGPITPVVSNQIVANGGAGSNPGGVPTGSVRDRTLSNLNFGIEYSNIRII